MSGRRLGLAGTVLVILGVVLVGASAAVGADSRTGGLGWFGGMMAGSGHGPGMMGRYLGGASSGSGPQPGASGFVAGTVAAPRVIPVIAGPGYAFSPSIIPVQRGETITFQVTSMGPLIHEFMVGPAAAVAADQEGTPEVADIGMMATKSLTYTFDGNGPYAFACHASGHYEAGMRGTITVVG